MNEQTKEEFEKHARAASTACGTLYHSDRVGVILTVMDLAYLRGQKDALKEDTEKLRNVLGAMPQKVFFQSPGIPGIYGKRVWVANPVPDELRERMSQLSAWGGPDKKTERFTSWEFPSETYRERATQSVQDNGYKEISEEEVIRRRLM